MFWRYRCCGNIDFEYLWTWSDQCRTGFFSIASEYDSFEYGRFLSWAVHQHFVWVVSFRTGVESFTASRIISQSSSADLSRLDSIGCLWRYCQTIREAWESVLRVLENKSQSVLFQLYLIVLESVVTSSEIAKISNCIVAWSEPVEELSSTAQFIIELWMAWDVKARSIIEVPLAFQK